MFVVMRKPNHSALIDHKRRRHLQHVCIRCARHKTFQRCPHCAQRHRRIDHRPQARSIDAVQAIRRLIGIGQADHVRRSRRAEHFGFIRLAQCHSGHTRAMFHTPRSDLNQLVQEFLAELSTKVAQKSQHHRLGLVIAQKRKNQGHAGSSQRHPGPDRSPGVRTRGSIALRFDSKLDSGNRHNRTKPYLMFYTDVNQRNSKNTSVRLVRTSSR